MDEKVRRISRELAKVDERHLRAFADGDRVIFVIQDAPDQLRQLADALERINVREIRAMVAYDPTDADVVVDTKAAPPNAD